MDQSVERSPLSKVHYRPIEAAIRWTCLWKQEREILEVLQTRNPPAPGDFPQWPTLWPNAERIFDGRRNGARLRTRWSPGRLTTMQQPGDIHTQSKVYYRPLEAAIRWCGLVQHERYILDVLQGKKLPAPNDFPEWPALRLNTERIYDAIRNGELPCGIDGITVQNGSSLDHPLLAIRHIDLRTWMIQFYPEQKPDFLFSPIEQKLHSGVTIETVSALVFERDALRSQIQQRDQELQNLQTLCNQYIQLLKASEGTNRSDAPLTPRAETTYLHIIGGLVSLVLGRSPSGQPYSSFHTQESIVSAMIAHCGELMGISERTLHAKFAAARRKLAGD